MTSVHHRYADVDGRKLFYREAALATHLSSSSCTGSRPARSCFAT